MLEVINSHCWHVRIKQLDHALIFDATLQYTIYETNGRSSECTALTQSSPVAMRPKNSSKSCGKLMHSPFQPMSNATAV